MPEDSENRHTGFKGSSVPVEGIPACDREVIAQNPDIQTVDLMAPDVNGLMRGKRIMIEQLAKTYQEGCSLPYSLYALDVAGNTVESTGYGFQTGDRDAECRPIPGSLQPVDWTSPVSAQLLLEMLDGSQPFAGSPRVVLAQILEAFTSLDLHPIVALEYEFYLTDVNLNQAGSPQPPINPETRVRENNTQVYSLNDLDSYRDFINDACFFAQRQHIDTEAIISEYAPGQFEINTKHSDDILLVCDQMVRLKRAIKAAAKKNNFNATFMARPYPDYSGSGAHLHLSLLDADQQNLFSGSEGAPNKWMSYALGGMSATLNDFILLFAPHINSYRRFQPNLFVPLAATWGYNNRSVAFRIPKSDAKNLRIEHRVAGADANPYLLTAAVLAGVLSGIKQRMNPGEMTSKDSVLVEPTIPGGMAKAIELFESGQYLHEYFNPAFVDLYLKIKREELANFRLQITPLEYEWYLHNC